MNGFKRCFSLVWICLMMVAFVLAPKVALGFSTDEKEPDKAASVDVPDKEGANPGNPSWFELEIGGETFYTFSPESNKGIGGLAAIMVDMDVQIGERLFLFGAFHFDSSIWHDYLNKPSLLREAQPDYDIELEVEEFFITWSPAMIPLEITAGRMFSVVSYANQLHLADFQFNMKPRIFTAYWGDNHGVALDGASVKWYRETDRNRVAFLAEAAKNGYDDEYRVFTTTLDMALNIGSIDWGLRGFGYFDHQANDHPFLKQLGGDNAFAPELEEGMGLNAWGGGTNILWKTPGNRSLFFQTEWVNRKINDHFLTGGYAFVVLEHSDKFSSSLMYQQLEIPDFQTGGGMDIVNERAYTVGLSYFPVYDHRLRIEYNHFSNSSFYDSMLLAKWTFFINF